MFLDIKKENKVQSIYYTSHCLVLASVYRVYYGAGIEAWKILKYFLFISLVSRCLEKFALTLSRCLT